VYDYSHIQSICGSEYFNFGLNVGSIVGQTLKIYVEGTFDNRRSVVVITVCANFVYYEVSTC
jgi:hypothetical protein